jgi:hypothetical protein
LVKVAPEKPTTTMPLVTPGTSVAICSARRITVSVRASEAPGGSCAATMMMPRSSCGMKPIGVLRNSFSP